MTILANLCIHFLKVNSLNPQRFLNEIRKENTNN